MRKLRVVARVMLLLAFLISGLVSAAGVQRVAAQDGAQSYTSPLTGQAIQTTGVWTIDVGAVESGDGFEFVSLYGQTDGMIVAFLPAGTDLVAARDIFLSEFSATFDTVVPIDRGAYGNVSYSLDITSTEGVEFGMFSLFLGQRSSGFVEYYLYFAPILAFQQSMSVAQQSVTVGGNKVFDGVAPAGLQTLLTANAGVTGSSTEVPSENVVESPTEAAPQPPGAPPTQVAQDPGPASNDGATYIEMIQEELTYLQGTLDDFTVSFAALQGDDSGTAATDLGRITSEWIGYPEAAAAISAPPGFEDIHASYQALAADVGTMGAAWLAVVEALQAGDQATTDTAIGEFLAVYSSVSTDIGTLESDLAARGQSPVPAAPPTQVPVEAPTEVPAPEPTEEPEPTQEVTDLTSGTGKATSRPDVSLPPGKGGTAPVGQNETETGRGGEGPDLSQYEELGLLAEGEYVSPLFDVGITWDDTWYFDASYDDPIVSDTAEGLDSVSISWTGDGNASIFVTLVAADGVAPEEIVDYWTSDDYLADTSSPDAEVLLQETSRSGSASVLVRDYLDDGTEVSIIRGALCADTRCDTLVMVTMFALPDVMPDAYGDARSGIEVEGERLFDVFSPRDITGAIGN